MKPFIFLLIAFSLSCGSSKKTTQEPDADQTIVDQNPVKNKAVYQVLSFNTTHCFGRCPVYAIQYFSNGQIVYEGKDNVDNKGRFVKMLDKVTQADLNKLIAHADLSNAEENYNPYTVDASVSHLYFTDINRDSYHTQGVFSFPDQIKLLIDYIKDNFDTVDKSWTKANLPRPVHEPTKEN